MTMRAIVQHHAGNPDVLKLGEIPPPVPSPTQVLVDVKATALNRADTLQRGGFYPPPEGESEILGLELAGVVTQVGDQVEGIAVRDRIFGLIGSGGYAEQAVIDYRLAMPIPEGWTFAQAAAVTEVFFTANETLFTRGQLADGETVLIHAGGSGVGSAGIQLAYQAGATVLVTAGSEQKIERTKALGATAGINYKKHDFAEQIWRLTENQGVNLVQDFIGAGYLSRNLLILKFEGRLVVVGLLSVAIARIDKRPGGTVRSTTQGWVPARTNRLFCFCPIVNHGYHDTIGACVQDLHDLVGFIPGHPNEGYGAGCRDRGQQLANVVIVEHAVLHIQAQPVKTGVSHDFNSKS